MPSDELEFAGQKENTAGKITSGIGKESTTGDELLSRLERERTLTKYNGKDCRVWKPEQSIPASSPETEEQVV